LDHNITRLVRLRVLLLLLAYFLLGVMQIKLPIYVINELVLIGGDVRRSIITLTFSLILFVVIVILSINQ
jgi:hypothetical protein